MTVSDGVNPPISVLSQPQTVDFARLNGLHTFCPGTNFRAWLFRIAHNTFANHRRSTRPRQPYPEDLPADDEGPHDRWHSTP